MKKVTLEDIGKKLNVSKVAVYKALNNKEGISDKLRADVKALAEELGYRRPNSIYKTNLNFVYFIKKEFFLSTGEQFYTEIYYYLNAECEHMNSTLNIVFNEKNSSQVLKNYLTNQKNGPPAGIFVVGEVDEELFSYLPTIDIPIVFIDYYSPLYNFDYVYVDHYNLSYCATNILIDSGHKQIGFIGDIHSTSAIRDRYLGYMKALIEKDFPINPEHHINSNIERMSVIENVLPKKLPTAFVCHCDSAAQKLYLFLKVRRLNVPEDVSVISFDNTDICKMLVPPLTSLGVSKEKYAKRAYQAMINIINKTSRASHNILRPIIAERKSIKSLE